MPAFDLTTRQRRALRALDWLYDSSDETRRTGRTTVLALSYLRRLLVHRRFYDSDPEGDWIDVEDHAGDGRRTDRMLVQEIQAIAHRYGYDGIEVHPAGARVRRSRRARPIPDELYEALTEFGDLPDDALRPPPQPRMTRTMVTREGVTVIIDAPEPEPPVRTFWDHLTEP